MPLDIVTVPCRRDNYAYLAHDAKSGQTALVDIPAAAPILDELAARGWRLSHVLITHHHQDHVEGLDEVLARHPAQVIGAAADAYRLPPLDREVTEGDEIAIGGETARVMDVSGHTIGHLAFYFPASHAAFTADSLMALGCGRVFEGTMEMMWASLCRLAALPGETVICSGHEYTQANGRFALTVEPDNTALLARLKDVDAARAADRPTVPSLLSLEKRTNPFLRAGVPDIAAGLGIAGAPAVDVFAELRRRKDKF
ncbi:MAG: hydroxyacylglutathione hydrolase [Marinibacterium sp.]